ncbi:MAG: DUF547 domain-containing protein [Simkaniaceae bacterium]
MLKTLIRTCVILFISNAAFGSDLVDNWLNTYNPLLKHYVVKGKKGGIESTLVNYNGLRSDPNFRKALYELARLPSLDTLEKKEQLAMWINAYNMLVLKVIVENPKIQSIKELDSAFGSIWKKKVGVVAGKQYTLDEIEHEIIRKKFNEPRVHFVLNCSALSCPDLANYAYEGKHLEEQLAYQAKQFLNNPTKGMSVNPSKEKIYLSKIFKWYKSDFPPSVIDWLIHMGFLHQDTENYSTSYMKYDWALNSLSQ